MEAVSINIEPETVSTKERINAFVELTKPRIAFMLVLTSAAGFYMGTAGAFNFALFFHSMCAILLLAFGVATLNQCIERKTDALMERTAGRPLPMNKLTFASAVIFGVMQCVVAEIYLFTMVNALTGWLGISVIIGYVFMYTPLKTRTSASTAIGAIPGAMPPLMGWTAANGEITVMALALFGILFLWQFPHFFAIAWLYREQYERAGIIMLPVIDKEGSLTARQIVIFTAFLFPIALTPFFIGMNGWIYLIGAVLAGIWFLFESIKTARAKDAKHSRRLLLVSVLYLPILFGFMVINKI